MQTPTEHELKHISLGYDPIKAHQYYLRTRELKGRKRGRGDDSPKGAVGSVGQGLANLRDPRTGKTKEKIHREAVAKQRKALTEQIDRLQARLGKLEALLQERATKEASEDRKGKAKKERAAKERDKPKSAAEKADAARESEKYRKKHKQELKNKAKDADKSDDSSDNKKTPLKKRSTEDLKALATKVKGQIAVAKQKLAAL